MKVSFLIVGLALAMAVPAAALADGFDHSAFDALLKKNVHGDTVDYQGFVGDKTFTAYVTAIGAQDPEKLGTKEEKLAFWINAYNAHTIASVLAHWPKIKSVQDPYPDFGFFKQKDKLVGGKKVGLNEIENDIVRPTFKDPRIHAALNCASVSCPPLLNEAFVAKTLDAQLDRVMTAFIRDDARNTITADGVKLSQIFNWYKDDFTAAGGVKAYLAKHLEGDKKAAIEKAEKFDFIEYNWSLNTKK